MVSFAAIFFIAICALALVNKSLTKTTTFSARRGIDNDNDKADLITRNVKQSVDFLRKKRSPQYDDIYDDYAESRHLKFGRRRKKHRKPHLLGLPGGQSGCRGHGCVQGHGWRPQPGGYYHQGPTGGQSFASASAGSSGHHNGGGQSHANAQSATFSLGPYSATFSHAEASADNRNHRPPFYFDY